MAPERINETFGRLCGRSVCVSLCTGDTYTGTLSSFDRYFNLHLVDCTLAQKGNELFIANVLIRKSSIVFIAEKYLENKKT
ncbi:hypothetical protein NEMIN01_0418 [Nematocida minor]|uniref:uncharacterized protein n=1 Tax=Nematocida minor TaxID=1912983 RepID=UPI0022203FC2|nr:uncharacterized protein NEMIN01_0418 [Nematocida minor]KAI5189355.1 hypothetical protein NEMIN01_0418 [Nematocida minor]